MTNVKYMCWITPPRHHRIIWHIKISLMTQMRLRKWTKEDFSKNSLQNKTHRGLCCPCQHLNRTQKHCQDKQPRIKDKISRGNVKQVNSCIFLKYLGPAINKLVKSRNLDLDSISNPCTFYISSDTAFRPFPMIFWNLLQYHSLVKQQVIYLLG